MKNGLKKLILSFLIGLNLINYIGYKIRKETINNYLKKPYDQPSVIYDFIYRSSLPYTWFDIGDT